MKNFLLNLQFIFMPHYWIMNDSYCEDWDKKLNELLDKYEFTKIDSYSAYLGENRIWIANRPYATLCPYIGKDDFRASRLTIKRGLKALRKAEKGNKQKRRKDSFKDFN